MLSAKSPFRVVVGYPKRSSCIGLISCSDGISFGRWIQYGDPFLRGCPIFFKGGGKSSKSDSGLQTGQDQLCRHLHQRQRRRLLQFHSESPARSHVVEGDRHGKIRNLVDCVTSLNTMRLSLEDISTLLPLTTRRRTPLEVSMASRSALSTNS